VKHILRPSLLARLRRAVFDVTSSVNRAIVNLLSEHYEDAKVDAEASIIPNTSPKAKQYNHKAYFRAGRASYGMQDYESAKINFGKALELDDDEATQEEYDRSTARVHEQITGEYNIPAISKSVRKKQPWLDHASFLSNVEVRDAGPRGRGLYTTKHLRFGDLVFAEKAFSVVYSRHYPKGSSTISIDDEPVSGRTCISRTKW
jgi:tetratricopeptide (TPR) repeat protein